MLVQFATASGTIFCTAAHSASAGALHHHADVAVTLAFVASIPGWLEQFVPS